MIDPETVNPQITDGLTQANVTVLGHGPGYAIAQTELALAQSQSVLFANMVSTQQQQALANSAAVTQGIVQLFSGNKSSSDGASSSAKALENLTNILKEKLSNIDQELSRF